MRFPNIISEIYNIFKDYYGEEYVDLQTYSGVNRCGNTGDYQIIVYWPSVEIKNEFDESITIWKLYCKILLASSGSLVGEKPLFLRAEYNEAQWNSDYMHSHVASIRRDAPYTWTDSCLGRGPLVGLGHNLSMYSSYYTDLEQWRLYAWYLDKYVHIESVSGIPYHRLNQVSNSGSRNTNYGFTPTLFDSIYISRNNGVIKNRIIEALTKTIRYIIDNKLVKFTFYNNAYNLGMSEEEFTLIASNAFISIYNDDINNYYSLIPKELLYSTGIIQDANFIDGKIYSINSSGTSLNSKLGTQLLTFKNKDITLQRNDATFKSLSKVTIFTYVVIGFIIYNLLKYININYGKTEAEINKKRRIF